VAGTNFNNGAVTDGAESVHDGVARVVVDQEVLSELGSVLQMYAFIAGQSVSRLVLRPRAR